MRRVVVGGLVFALLLALACSRGPGAALLQEDLQRRIDTGFAEGLFTIRSLARTGSAPFSDPAAGAEGSGLFVYYDAELELLRDYSLTSWRGLNLGTLAFAVGATESGVIGFDAEGNRKGDVLRVHGRLSYRQMDGGWQPSGELPSPAPEPARGPVTLEGTGPRAVLQRVRELIARDTTPEPGTRDAAIVEELERATGRVDLRLARLEGRLALGTGRRPGTYHQFGVAFAREAGEHGLPLYSYASEGSVENGRDLNTRRVDFALIQSDVAETLFAGWIREEQLPQPNLRSVASLWPEAVHLVAVEGAGVAALTDLAGKRISLGDPQSGTRFSALRLMGAEGLEKSDFAEVRRLGLAESIAALEAGQIDAFFATEAVPSAALQALAQRRADVRFVPIGRDVAAQLSEDYFSYYSLEVPARTYPGQATPFRTLGLAAILMTNRLTRDADVERVLELVLDSANALSRVFYRAGFISQETVRLGIAVRLHPAAERFYAERTP